MKKIKNGEKKKPFDLKREQTNVVTYLPLLIVKLANFYLLPFVLFQSKILRNSLSDI